MIKALKRLNEALPGLLLGIAIYGLIVEFAGVWFVSGLVDRHRLRYGHGNPSGHGDRGSGAHGRYWNQALIL